MTSTRCPICDRQFQAAETTAMPFCSERCRHVDLGRWLDEQNCITVERVPDEFEEEQEDAAPRSE